MKKSLAAIGLLLCSSAFAALPGAGSFWDKSGEGYWWYAQEPQPKKEPPVVVAQQTKQPEKPEQEPKEQKTAAPAVFSADWVEENLKVYRRLAWDNPTVENLRAYLYLQRFAIDRSEQFAYAGQMAVQGDPFLDEVARAPLGGSMNVNRTTYINAEQGHLLSNRSLFTPYVEKVVNGIMDSPLQRRGAEVLFFR